MMTEYSVCLLNTIHGTRIGGTQHIVKSAEFRRILAN